MMNALRIKQPEAGLNRSRMSAISVCTHARLLPFSWSGPVGWPRGVKACVRTGQLTQRSRPSSSSCGGSISSKSWSQSQYCDTVLGTAPSGHVGESGRCRRPRGYRFRAGIQVRRAGACGVPASASLPAGLVAQQLGDVLYLQRF